jgi:hypothetical protein
MTMAGYDTMVAGQQPEVLLDRMQMWSRPKWFESHRVGRLPPIGHRRVAGDDSSSDARAMSPSRPLLLVALALIAASTAPPPLPRHPHFPKVLECKLPDDHALTVRYQTATFDGKGAEAMKVGGAWHLAGATLETAKELVIGGCKVAAGKYALTARKRTLTEWELVLHEGNGFSTKIGPDAHVLKTEYSADSWLFEHLNIDVQPAGDKANTVLHLDVRFDRRLARVRINLPQGG